jgi:hypothetical protein
MYGSSVLKSTHGSEKTGLTAMFVAEGLSLEVKCLIIGGAPMYQVSLSEKPGHDPCYVKMFTRGMI